MRIGVIAFVRNRQRYLRPAVVAAQSLTVVLVAFLAAGIASPMLYAQSSKPNIVVLVLDQLRADELHVYGNSRQTSPNIDQLAAQGTIFKNYYTVAPWTAPSFATLYTSLFPSKHGITLFWRQGQPLLNKDVPTLAQNLKSAGYRTAAFVDNSLGGRPLIGQGFDEFVDSGAAAPDITDRLSRPQIGAPFTTERVLDWLNINHKDAPFYLYVHYIEPHSPYNPPEQDDLFKSDAYPYLFNDGYDFVHGSLLRLAQQGDKKAIERLYQLYDGKIHYIDGFVGQILARLHELGLDDNTYVLLTSDHGELLYSHPKDFQTFDHRSLYDTVLHIPFIVAGPKVPQHNVVTAIASNLDFAPTVLSLAGADPLTGAEGSSLVPLIDGQTKSINEYTYAEEDVEIPERSVQSLEWKLIRNLWNGEQQLFNLKQDPGELNDVAKSNANVVRELSAKLDQWQTANEPSREVQLRRWKIYTELNTSVVVDDIGIGAAFLISHPEDWHSDENPRSGNYNGASYWTTPGDGSRTALWRGDTPFIGRYKVYYYAGRPGKGDLATNATFTITTETGIKTVTLDLKSGANTWQLLGTFDNPRTVELTNAANGIVVADAVRFDRISR
jgi:arylsulfatase A-like enzyme